MRWRSFLLESERFAGTADVLTFAPPESFSTKIRALYQCRKGRNLFDLWLALTELGLRGDEIVSAFWPYRVRRTHGCTRRSERHPASGARVLRLSMWPSTTGSRSWYASSSHARAWLPS